MWIAVGSSTSKAFDLSFVVDVRRSLHLRLGLPLDRPLLRIANSINLFARDGARGNSIRKGSLLWTRISFCHFFSFFLFGDGDIFIY